MGLKESGIVTIKLKDHIHIVAQYLRENVLNVLNMDIDIDTITKISRNLHMKHLGECPNHKGYSSSQIYIYGFHYIIIFNNRIHYLIGPIPKYKLDLCYCSLTYHINTSNKIVCV